MSDKPSTDLVAESHFDASEKSPIIDPAEELEGFHKGQIVTGYPSHLDSQIIAILCQLFVDGVATTAGSLVADPTIKHSWESEAQAQVALTERRHDIDMSLRGKDKLTGVVLFIQRQNKVCVAHVTYYLIQS